MCYKQKLGALVKNREPTGLLDRSGKEIHTGDIVEFYYKPGLERGPRTRMRDIVLKDQADGQVYFMCRAGGAYAWRYNERCKIIGTDVNLIDT